MMASHIHSPTHHSNPGVLAEITPLLPPRPPLPEAPPMAAPMIYVKKSVTWEYKQLIRNLGKEATLTTDELNALGQEGWELTGVTTDAPLVYFYFKRLSG